MARIETIAVTTYLDKAPGPRPLSNPILQAVTFEAASSVELGRAFGDLVADVERSRWPSGWRITPRK